jgi:hypothetical protein
MKEDRGMGISWRAGFCQQAKKARGINGLVEEHTLEGCEVIPAPEGIPFASWPGLARA